MAILLVTVLVVEADAVIGKTNVDVPATSGDETVNAPLVLPLKIMLAIIYPILANSP